MRVTRIMVVLTLAFMCLGVANADERMDSSKKTALEWLESNRTEIREAALAIHSFAELGLQETRSSELLAGMLEREGFTVERGTAGMPTAFVATWGSGSPVIGILAEYDAIPGVSQKAGVPVHSPVMEGGSGHGCGHNLFGAASVSSAIAIRKAMEAHSIGGTVKLFGCPAEETLVGKAFMARDGVFEGLDICFHWHPGQTNFANLGSNRALNSFEIEFYGKTAHAAADPWNGRSALDAVELMSAGVNFLREHMRDSARIHYVILNGGDAPNVVPAYAKVWYFVRERDRESVDELYARVLKCAEGAALMTGTRMELNFISGIYNYLPNASLTRVLYDNMKLAGSPEHTIEEIEFAKELQRSFGVPERGLAEGINDFVVPTGLTGGSTDVADVSWIVPTAGIYVATSPLGIPGHSWGVTASSGSTVGLKGMETAAKSIALAGIEALLDPEVIVAAKKEFAEKTAGTPFRSALPDDLKLPSTGR